MAQRHPGGKSHLASAAGLTKGVIRGALRPSNTLARGREELPVLVLLVTNWFELPAGAAKKYGLSSLLCVPDILESDGPGPALNSTRKRTPFSVMPFSGFVVG